MNVVGKILMGLVFIFLLGCEEENERLLGPEDSEFSLYEEPETENECFETTECTVNCLNSCTFKSTMPITCLSDPEPIPHRLESAICVCEMSRCMWKE